MLPFQGSSEQSDLLVAGRAVQRPRDAARPSSVEQQAANHPRRRVQQLVEIAGVVSVVACNCSREDSSTLSS